MAGSIAATPPDVVAMRRAGMAALRNVSPRAAQRIVVARGLGWVLYFTASKTYYTPDEVLTLAPRNPAFVADCILTADIVDASVRTTELQTAIDAARRAMVDWQSRIGGIPF